MTPEKVHPPRRGWVCDRGQADFSTLSLAREKTTFILQIGLSALPRHQRTRRSRDPSTSQVGLPGYHHRCANRSAWLPASRRETCDVSHPGGVRQRSRAGRVSRPAVVAVLTGELAGIRSEAVSAMSKHRSEVARALGRLRSTLQLSGILEVAVAARASRANSDLSVPLYRRLRTGTKTILPR